MIVVFCKLLRRGLIGLNRLRRNRRRSRRMQRLIVGRPSCHVPLESIMLIRDFFYRGLKRCFLRPARTAKPIYHLNIRVIWIERRLFRFLGWIGQIRVHVRFDGFGNTKSMIFCELNL